MTPESVKLQNNFEVVCHTIIFCLERGEWDLVIDKVHFSIATDSYDN